MRCSRNRLNMDAASADRSRPSSTNTVTSHIACVIWRETRRTTRHAAWRRLDSGFVSAIKFYRARMGLSVRSDVAGRAGRGGIFSF